MAPPPEKGLLRKRLEERRTTLAKLKGQGDEPSEVRGTGSQAGWKLAKLTRRQIASMTAIGIQAMASSSGCMILPRHCIKPAPPSQN
jgi:hypothetical protein